VKAQRPLQDLVRHLTDDAKVIGSERDEHASTRLRPKCAQCARAGGTAPAGDHRDERALLELVIPAREPMDVGGQAVSASAGRLLLNRLVDPALFDL
jgi:hypothetical protein